MPAAVSTISRLLRPVRRSPLRPVAALGWFVLAATSSLLRRSRMVRELHHPSPAEARVNDENAPPRDSAPMEPPLPPAARRPPLVSNQTAASALKRKQLATTGKASVVKTKEVASPRFGVSAPVEVPQFKLQEDPSFWEHNSVQVVIRVRPLNNDEKRLHRCNRCLKQNTSKSLTWIGSQETQFTFDHVACETTSQEEFFRVVGLPIVEKCIAGHNCCIFAYGQTGSGKTHTMLGKIGNLEAEFDPNRGMSPRIFEVLFAKIRVEESKSGEKLKYTCKCSFLEIYNEQITDLLEPSSVNLPIREDAKRVYVENLTEVEVGCVPDVVNLLEQGSHNRKVASTNINHESSRSHSIFTCKISSMWEKESERRFHSAQLNLVDLAGSERPGTSGVEGEALKEANFINKSLSTLGLVVRNLADIAVRFNPTSEIDDGGAQHIRHVPYRDSRLTYLLQHSLGGNSNTVVVGNISPSVGYAGETLSTLKFAQRARLIQNKAVNVEVAGGVEMENSSWNRENLLNLQLELEIYKAMLVEEITARGEVENLLKKRDMVVCELIERWQQDRASLSSFEQQVKLLDRTISDLETTVTALESKMGILKHEAEQERVQRQELDHELQKVRARSFTEDRTSQRQPSIALNSAERYAKSPKTAKHDDEQPTGKRRRHARKWSSLEAEALKKGVQTYGHGQWKQILINNLDCFNGRTAVDLKDNGGI